MNTKSTLFLIVVALSILVAGVLVFKKSDYYQKMQDGQRENFPWPNNWGNEGSTPEQPAKPEKPEKPEKPQSPQGQVKADTFEQAKSLADQYNRPILIIFSAKWCKWCKQLESETLTDAKVQEAMQGYILLQIDTDKDRTVATQFDVKSLPAIVITNSKEQKLKTNFGFIKSSDFIKWLKP